MDPREQKLFIGLGMQLTTYGHAHEWAYIDDTKSCISMNWIQADRQTETDRDLHISNITSGSKIPYEWEGTSPPCRAHGGVNVVESSL